MTAASPPPPVRLHIADLVIARVAAHRALAVPGVSALLADPGQAAPVAGPARNRPAPPAGVLAAVRDGAVEVALSVATRSGYNCRDLAQAVQDTVAGAVAGYTGLACTVTVTIAEVLLAHRTSAQSSHSPAPATR